MEKVKKDIAVVIPYYQKTKGVLKKALNSVLCQTAAERIVVILVDDESPYPVQDELDSMDSLSRDQIILIQQKNGGAGAARNKALDNIPEGVKYVAFLDSDDEWFENHVENGIVSLSNGVDAYFSDHYPAVSQDQSNFKKIGTLKVENHEPISKGHNLYQMSISMIDHIISDGGGVIGTSNVIYDYSKFPQLRFREEFYNGQDFFFWMDLSNQGAQWGFSTELECRCGEGINIYSGSGWGSEKSLQRLRNELFIWTSVEKFYNLTPLLLELNNRTLKHLKGAVVRDVIHRVARLKPISLRLLKDIFGMSPDIIIFFLSTPFILVKEKLM